MPFFIPDFYLLSYIESFYIDVILEQNKILEHIYNTLTVPCEKSKVVSLAHSIMKNIAPPAAGSRFPVKLISCIAFGSSSSACCVLKSIAIIL